MRNIVEHGQISGSSDTTVLSGCSAAMRCTMWISVPTPITDPGRRRARPTRGCARSSRPGRRARRPRARTRGARSPRRRGARRGTRRRARAGTAGAPSSGPSTAGSVASLTSRSSSPPSSWRGFHTRMSRLVVAHLVAGVAAEVLVGEEQHLVAPWRSAHSRTARAFDDVHTAPPCAPTNAFSAADEFM